MQAMLDAGATLVQIYTALVFQGPGVVARLISAG
jgi:dihydroorotate dehydrogenase